MKTFETLIDAISDLQKRGYTNDFNLHPEWIECPQMKVTFNPQEFHVDEVHRFEGMTNPSDSSVLYAIRSADGMLGILVDAYGPYSVALSDAMNERLKIDSQTKH